MLPVPLQASKMTISGTQCGSEDNVELKAYLQALLRPSSKQEAQMHAPCPPL